MADDDLEARAARMVAALKQIRFSGNYSHPAAVWMQKVAAHAMEPTKWPHPGEQRDIKEFRMDLRARLEDYCHEMRGSGVDEVEIGNFIDWLERSS